MEKEANQLYRRPQMTGQARDEEEGRKPKLTVKNNELKNDSIFLKT